MPRVVARSVVAIAVAWLAALFVAPLAVANGRGAAAVLVTYQAASLVCHQRPERSLRVGGTQMPVCARCFGLYAGFVAGALAISTITSKGRSSVGVRRTRILLASAAAPMVLTVVLEMAGGIEATNLLRLLTGLAFGAAAGWVLLDTLQSAG
jgi:uncharacterized membrane protein